MHIVWRVKYFYKFFFVLSHSCFPTPIFPQRQNFNPLLDFFWVYSPMFWYNTLELLFLTCLALDIINWTTTTEGKNLPLCRVTTLCKSYTSSIVSLSSFWLTIIFSVYILWLWKCIHSPSIYNNFVSWTTFCFPYN